jgi:uncharacterized membrane protein|tara:strand:+ start:367 stop:750 length:384 start_codon:yes stop_codon:yes gene_type:complete
MSISQLAFVGLIWGVTGPFIGNTSKPMQTSLQTKSKSIFQNLTQFKQKSVMIAYLVNQLGSLLFNYVLVSGELPVSKAVPVANSLSLLVATIMSIIVFPEVTNKPNSVAIILGSFCVCLGIALSQID